MEHAYEEYYRKQAGAGATRPADSIGPVYRASFTKQNGRGGCCGIGRVISAAATPLIAKGIRAVGEEAALASMHFYQDVQRDPSIRAVGHAAANRLAEAGQNLKVRARKALTGRGARGTKKKRTKTSPSKKTKKKGRVTAKGRGKTSTKRKTGGTSKKRIKAKGKRPKAQSGRGTLPEQVPHDIFTAGDY